MSETPERPTISRAEYERRVAIRRKRLRRKRIQRGIIALIILAVLIIGIVLICKSCSSGSSITGTWDYDTVTVYRFDKNGKGALELPNGTYAFTYKTDGEKLSVDFENESATDSTYTYTVTGDTLTLVSEDGRTFAMKKAN